MCIGQQNCICILSISYNAMFLHSRPVSPQGQISMKSFLQYFPNTLQMCTSMVDTTGQKLLLTCGASTWPLLNGNCSPVGHWCLYTSIQLQWQRWGDSKASQLCQMDADLMVLSTTLRLFHCYTLTLTGTHQVNTFSIVYSSIFLQTFSSFWYHHIFVTDFNRFCGIFSV